MEHPLDLFVLLVHSIDRHYKILSEEDVDNNDLCVLDGVKAAERGGKRLKYQFRLHGRTYKSKLITIHS